MMLLTACNRSKPPDNTLPSDSSQNNNTWQETDTNISEGAEQTNTPYTVHTKISEVINDSAFGDYGRLIFPVDDGYYSGDTLGDLSLVWYSHIVPETTVEIANYFKSNAENGNRIFYPIYTDEEIKADLHKTERCKTAGRQRPLAYIYQITGGICYA